MSSILGSWIKRPVAVGGLPLTLRKEACGSPYELGVGTELN